MRGHWIKISRLGGNRDNTGVLDPRHPRLQAVMRANDLVLAAVELGRLGGGQMRGGERGRREIAIGLCLAARLRRRRKKIATAGDGRGSRGWLGR